MDLKEQYERLLRYCYTKTKDRSKAEDFVQETFLRFWQTKSYKDTGKELAYLYTIARNLIVDDFRKPALTDIDIVKDEALSYQNIEAYLERMELEKAIESLPDELREIIILRFANEVPVSVIAEILGISRFSVHRRMKEGLSILRSMMEGDDD